MYPSSRALAVLVFFSTLLMGPAQGGGEYQGFEPSPQIVDIRFSESGIAFMAGANAYVPGGPRYFELLRGAADWHRIEVEDFERYPANRWPASVYVREGRFRILSTSEGEHFIDTDYQCMEGRELWAGLRRDGDWFPTHASNCVNISALESANGKLFLGTSLVGEAGMFYGAEGINVVDAKTGALIKRLGHVDNLHQDAMLNLLRRDPFTDDVWAATLTGLWRITPALEIVDRVNFVDRWDPQTQTVRTHLAKNEQTDYVAQYVRMMNVENAAPVYEFLRAQCKPGARRCGFNLMYALGMGPLSAWQGVQGREVFLPFVLGGALHGNSGSVSHAFMDELLAFGHTCVGVLLDEQREYSRNRAQGEFTRTSDCLRKSGVELAMPLITRLSRSPRREDPPSVTSTRLHSPPREGKLHVAENWIKDAVVHAAWFAWRGAAGENGEYAYTAHCLDFATVRPGDDRYYRFPAKTFERAGDWVGVETRYAIESSEFAEPYRSDYGVQYFQLPPSELEANSQGSFSEGESLARLCREHGVQSADLVALDQRSAEREAARKAAIAAEREKRRKQDAILRMDNPPQISVSLETVSEDGTRKRFVQEPGGSVRELKPGEPFPGSTAQPVLQPDVSVRQTEMRPDDPRILEILRKKGIVVDPPEKTNPYIEQMKRERQEKEAKRDEGK